MKLNSILLGTTALAFLACSASAQDSADWTGFYAGADASFINGAYSALGYDLEFENSSAAAGGFFAGYNTEMNGVIVGAELAWSQASYSGVDASDYRFSSGLIDTKVSAGLPMGDWLTYITIGASAGDFDYNGLMIGMTGTAFGAGVSRKITDSLFVGAEVLQRKMSNANPVKIKKSSSLDADFRTISVRVGYEF